MIDWLSKGIQKRRIELQGRFQSLSGWTLGSKTPSSPASSNIEIPALDAASAAQQFAQYEMRPPVHQNAIDLLPGWTSAFPSQPGLTAGNVPLFADTRIQAALDAHGTIEGQTLLEVGPLEGMHTYMLNQRRPVRIDAIEANKLCFLRCLVTKEILKLDRTNFYLGDIQSWLAETQTVYDLAIASGVLYHMQDPAKFLSMISAQTNSLFIWTHFYDEAAMPPSDLRLLPFSGKVEIRNIDGLNLHYHERSYKQANTDASFCGGMKDRHYWMRRDEILSLLRHLGFNELEELDVDLEHAGGPCFSVFARKHTDPVAPVG